MTSISILWPMISGVCVALAAIHLIAWLKQAASTGRGPGKQHICPELHLRSALLKAVRPPPQAIATQLIEKANAGGVSWVRGTG